MAQHAKLINEHIAGGTLVPVSITVALIKNAMKDAFAKGTGYFLVDGFPRNQDNLDVSALSLFVVFVLMVFFFLFSFCLSWFVLVVFVCHLFHHECAPCGWLTVGLS